MITGWAGVGEALGVAVIQVEPAPWGNTNCTHILTLADGRRAVWGDVGYVAAGHDLSDPMFPHVAADMGRRGLSD